MTINLFSPQTGYSDVYQLGCRLMQSYYRHETVNEGEGNEHSSIPVLKFKGWGSIMLKHPLNHRVPCQILKSVHTLYSISFLSGNKTCPTCD